MMLCFAGVATNCGKRSGSDHTKDRDSASAELCSLESLVTTPVQGVNLRQVVVGDSHHRPGDSAIAGASAKGVSYEVATPCQPGKPYIDPRGKKRNQWHLVKLAPNEGSGTWFSDQWVSETEGTLLRNFAWIAAGMLDGCHCEGYANAVNEKDDLISDRPALVVDHLGRATLVWINSDGELMAKQTDRKGTWSDPEAIQQLTRSDEQNDTISRDGAYQRMADTIRVSLFLNKRWFSEKKQSLDEKRDELMEALQQQEDYAAESGSDYSEDEEVLNLVDELYTQLNSTVPDAKLTLSDALLAWDDKATSLIRERRDRDEQVGIERGSVTTVLRRFESHAYDLYFSALDWEYLLEEREKLEALDADPATADAHVWHYSYEYGAPEAVVDADNNVIVLFRVSLFVNEENEEFQPIRLRETLFAKKFNANTSAWEETVRVKHYEGVEAVSHQIRDFDIAAKKSDEALAVYAVEDEMIASRWTGHYFSRWGDGLHWEPEVQLRNRISGQIQDNLDVAIAKNLDRHAVACWSETASDALMAPEEIDKVTRITIIDCVRHNNGVWEEMTSPVSEQDAARIRFEGVVPPPGHHVSNHLADHADFGDIGDLVLSADGDAHVAWRLRQGGVFETSDSVFVATCPANQPTRCNVVRLTDPRQRVGLTQIELALDRMGRTIARWDAWLGADWNQEPIYQQRLYDPERNQWGKLQQIEVIGDGTAQSSFNEDKFDLSEHGHAAAVWPRNATIDGQWYFNQLVIQFFHGDDPWDSSTWSDVEALGPQAGSWISWVNVRMDDQGRVIFVLWLRTDDDGNEIWETKRLVAREDPLGQLQAPALFESETLGVAPSLAERLTAGNPLGLSLSR